MSDGIRTYDSNTKRKANKPFLQLEKNILEQNYFSYLAVVKELNKGEAPFENKWCSVDLIPTIQLTEFIRQIGYSSKVGNKNSTLAFIPKDMVLAVGDIVLLSFTDVNFKKTILDILKGYNKNSSFLEADISRHSIDFAIVTNIIL